jgi:hypothetical protein
MRRAVFEDPAKSDYLLPFPTGARHVVRQSYCFEQGGHSTQLAYDFVMPVGSDVVAARAGEVVALFEDAPDGEIGDDNYVFIRHDDGTVALYAHLTHDGVDVEVGQSVAAGERIGASGSSGLGLENTPHLHFGVYRSWPNADGDDVAVNFRNADGPLDLLGGLVMGASYEALGVDVASHPISGPGDYAGADVRGVELAGANLWGFDFGGADLSGANLAGSDLAWASLTAAGLVGANLANANLMGADFVDADCSRADLSGADLTRANLRGTNLTGADLSGAYLAVTNLAGADLTGADLDSTVMIGVRYDDTTRWPDGFDPPPAP